MERISEISGTIGSGGSFYSADSWHKDMKFNPSIKPTMNEISDSPHQPMKTNTNLQDKVNSKLEISGFQGMGKRKGSNKSIMGGNNQFKSLGINKNVDDNSFLKYNKRRRVEMEFSFKGESEVG